MGLPRIAPRTLAVAAVAVLLGFGGLLAYLESGVDADPPVGEPAPYDPELRLASPEGLFEDPGAAVSGDAFPDPASPMDASEPERRPVEELLRAAEGGDTRAQADLGLIYKLGRGIAPDPVKAVVWLRKAAEAGDSKAQNNLGSLYYRGDGVLKDLDKAFEWYLQAAERGNRVAQLNLAVMYAQGRGITQDYEMAAEYYRRAAEAGDPRAQFDLSVLLSKGQGVERDEEAALLWRRRAAAQGYPEAGY